jgi:DNA-binding CsgD family transcriptional regulator
MTTETEPARPKTAAPLLTYREHQYLWLISQGHTPQQAFQVMGTGSSPSVAMRVKHKLHAATMEHAVFLACHGDLLGPHMDCGTLDGFRQHQGRGDLDPCRACRRAFAEYAERQNAPVLKKIVLTEPELRMLKAFDAGRSFKQILVNWGCSRRTLDDVRISLYRKLDVAHLPQQSKQATAVEVGRRLGYLRPEPAPLPQEVIVEHQPRPLTELEVRTLGLLAEGASLAEAGAVLGIQGAAVSSKLARIYAKLDVLHHDHGERRSAAVAEARKQGYPV